MAARCISTPASRCPAASRRPCAIFARSRRRSISTCRRGMNRCCPICEMIPRCAQNSSIGCMRCSSRVRRCRRSSGTASTNWRCRRPVFACRCSPGSAPPRPRRSSCRQTRSPAAPAMSDFRCPATRLSSFQTTASSRFAPGGRTSRQAIGVNRSSPRPPSTRKVFTSWVMRSSRPWRTISAPASTSMAASPRISSWPAAPGSASVRSARALSPPARRWCAMS
ncbi:hypothetical protein GALL_491520 [mine drainage metagenome]|uniref:Uncharacterized protein n=1 Tax=mine drainage metagenome TaxID=410659 RepID=A0A1J5PEN4_9ZZZZ